MRLASTSPSCLDSRKALIASTCLGVKRESAYLGWDCLARVVRSEAQTGREEVHLLVESRHLLLRALLQGCGPYSASPTTSPPMKVAATRPKPIAAASFTRLGDVTLISG
jgi:hypothetical protein